MNAIVRVMALWWISALATAVVVATPPNDNQNKSNYELIETVRGELVLGEGLNQSDLPFATCSKFNIYPENTTCLLATRSGSRSCNLTFFASTETRVRTIHQLTDEKLLLHVVETWNGEYSMMTEENLTLFDMSSCTRVYNVSLEDNKASHILAYEDGSYDVMLAIRGGLSRDAWRVDHYDASTGEKIGKSQNISLGWTDMYAQAASTKSRSHGLFVRGRPAFGGEGTTVKFLAGGSSVFQDVLTLNSTYDLLSYVDSDKYYTVCGRNMDDRSKVDCARFDMRTKQVFNAQLDWDKFDLLSHVRTSDNTGIVLFGIDEESDNVKDLIVAEMRLDGQSVVKRISLVDWNEPVTDNCRLLDFDGSARTFVFACEFRRFPRLPRAFALHKYNLPIRT